MKLAYLHIFVRRGRLSNTDISFQVQEVQNVAVYGKNNKRWERWNFSGFGSIVVFRLWIHSDLRKL